VGYSQEKMKFDNQVLCIITDSAIKDQNISRRVEMAKPQSKRTELASFS